MCPATLLANFGEPSADDIRGALEASRDAGATGVSVWTPYLQILGGAEPAAAIVKEVGLQTKAVEAAVVWPTGSPEEVLREARTFARLVAVAGATRLLAVCMEPALDDLDRAREGLAVLVDHVSAAGAQTCVEFLPWTGIPDLATAWSIVQPVGSGAGIVLDTWHWQRQPGGPNLALLAQIPGERIGYVQMCDAAPGEGREMEEAMTGRLLPGEGVVDYPALFATLAQIGADPFIATEIFNAALLTELGQQGFANASITSASSMAAA
jgi:sugar phosphate isomerase/epimerase